MSNKQNIAPNEKSSDSKESGGFFNSIWADITGAAATLFSGALSARHEINKAFYQNIKIAPEIGGDNGKAYCELPDASPSVIEESKAAHRKILQEVKEAPTKAAKKAIWREQLPAAHAAHDKKIADILRDDYAIENIIDRAAKLRPHQKWEIVTKVGATMAVTLGAVATVFALGNVLDEQKRLKSRLDNMEDNNQRQL